MKNTTLIHLEQNGCWLMLHRVKKKNDINHDKWIAPGGHVEENESPEECAYREFLEETGLSLTNMKYRGIVTFAPDQGEGEYMHLFSATQYEGTLIECSEGALEWVPIEHVYELPVWEGDKIFFRLLEEERPFFSLKLEYVGDRLTSAVLDGKKLKPCLAVSACLLGEKCRYDGKSKPNAKALTLKDRYELIPVCPEVAGGLPTPRVPCERRGERVIDKNGQDKTDAYKKGAGQVLKTCFRYGVHEAILKAKSPACGHGKIYDGTFSGTLIDGNGVTAEVLEKNGISIKTEEQI